MFINLYYWKLDNVIAFVIMKYSGLQIRSTPRDRENVLPLSEVDLIHIQRNIVKYSQVFNLVSRYSVIVSHRLLIRAVSPVSAGLLVYRPT